MSAFQTNRSRPTRRGHFNHDEVVTIVAGAVIALVAIACLAHLDTSANQLAVAIFSGTLALIDGMFMGSALTSGIGRLRQRVEPADNVNSMKARLPSVEPPPMEAASCPSPYGSGYYGFGDGGGTIGRREGR